MILFSIYAKLHKPEHTEEYPVNQTQKKIFTELTGKIFSGIYPSDSPIPGERELAHAHHTNIMNAKTAVNLLCRRGLVIRKRHKGTTATAHTQKACFRKILFSNEL